MIDSIQALPDVSLLELAGGAGTGGEAGDGFAELLGLQLVPMPDEAGDDAAGDDAAGGGTPVAAEFVAALWNAGLRPADTGPQGSDGGQILPPDRDGSLPSLPGLPLLVPSHQPFASILPLASDNGSQSAALRPSPDTATMRSLAAFPETGTFPGVAIEETPSLAASAAELPQMPVLNDGEALARVDAPELPSELGSVLGRLPASAWDKKVFQSPPRPGPDLPVSLGAKAVAAAQEGGAPVAAASAKPSPSQISELRPIGSASLSAPGTAMSPEPEGRGREAGGMPWTVTGFVSTQTAVPAAGGVAMTAAEIQLRYLAGAGRSQDTVVPTGENAATGDANVFDEGLHDSEFGGEAFAQGAVTEFDSAPTDSTRASAASERPAGAPAAVSDGARVAMGAIAPSPSAPMQGHGVASASQAPAPDSFVLSTPMGHPRWGEAFSAQIVSLARQDMRQAQIQLDPVDLGPIDIQLAMNGNEMSVAFQAQHATTREALEQSLPRLREMLQEAGMQLAQADVNGQSDRGQRAFAAFNSGEGRSSGREGDGRPAGEARPEPRRPAPSGEPGRIDYFA